MYSGVFVCVCIYTYMQTHTQHTQADKQSTHTNLSPGCWLAVKLGMTSATSAISRSCLGTKVPYTWVSAFMALRLGSLSSITTKASSSMAWGSLAEAQCNKTAGQTAPRMHPQALVLCLRRQWVLQQRLANALGDHDAAFAEVHCRHALVHVRMQQLCAVICNPGVLAPFMLDGLPD